MTVLMVPELDAKRWPTLGPLVCDWIERNLVFGPGDKRGEQAAIDDEKRALIYRMYEVHPQNAGDKAGRRRFRKVALSLRKGSAKTELMAWIAACELHPRSPVRCVGWTKGGEPIGGAVRDPYIPLVAYTEEQSDELAFGALRVILSLSKVAKDFDIGLERILRADGSGKAVSLASSPGARDGARTTFQGFDESHRFVLASLKKAHRVMIANLPKRKLADPWALETTTAFAPGEQSVAEDTMAYARAVAEGRKSDAKLFFFHRFADDSIAIYQPDGSVNRAGLNEAILDASGGLAAWTDLDGVAEQWNDPTVDRADLERLWLNRIKHSTARAFDVLKWNKALLKSEHVVPDGALITLGFDGSRYNDSTALIATEVETGFQWALGIWEKPFVDLDAHVKQHWEVPEAEVDEAVHAAFSRYAVWKLYGDPPNWETHMSKWSGEFGEDRVYRFRTNLWRKMAFACKSYRTAMQTGDVSHGPNGNDELARSLSTAFGRHIGNAHRMELRTLDEDRNKEWVIVKERKDSPNKMDAAVAGVLSWQARNDALSVGAEPPEKEVNESWAAEWA